MKQVWIAEYGEYDQRGVSFVAESPESALAYVKAKHPEGNWSLRDETWSSCGKTYPEWLLIGQVYVNRARSEETTEREFQLSQVNYAG